MSEQDNITRKQFIDEILPNNNGYIILKFTADWCGPCKSIKSLVEEKTKDLPSTIKYYEIDVDENIDLFSFFKSKKMCKGIPALFAFKKGNCTYIADHSVIGADSDEINKFFDIILTTNIQQTNTTESHY
jgi:thioredoxin 1